MKQYIMFVNDQAIIAHNNDDAEHDKKINRRISEFWV